MKPFPTRTPPPCAMTIAGSDSGGGAGIQADLRSFAAFGVHGLSAITAVTAQNTCGVTDIEMLPQRIVRAQIGALLDDFRVGAIKIGMLGTPALCRAIAETLESHRGIPLIVDPVLIATSGASLSRGRLVGAIRQYLIPRADLLTPNVPEAEQLVGRSLHSRDDLLDAAHALRKRGARAVLLKGGHVPGAEVFDVLVSESGTRWFSHPRIDVEGHGTGCTLAAAVAAGVARGASIEIAVADAIEFVNRALALSYHPGKGAIAVLDHLAAAPLPFNR
ncbi:MAG: bifunctional hydroxymethylpyrimidine kinase/phosphomethylpyrimidine kinase [Dokdonella sp.]|uniref:bifunctional hydroxymethylpyrimidine kinase/phosphomethylpyrimidine kinase n=5 Tax=Dokdonella sp. TaxID=2291710 RepID=UPI0031C96783|nr:bifunctional hydroxymethylpyrimidine kinase/phosphomethylpyrimidine kinase [Xanthomonadales bacterium]